MKKILRGFIKGWLAFGKAIGWVISNIILFIAYCLVFIPVSLALRIVRHDPMHRRILPEAESYWIDKTKHAHAEFKPEQCEHMY